MSNHPKRSKSEEKFHGNFTDQIELITELNEVTQMKYALEEKESELRRLIAKSKEYQLSEANLEEGWLPIDDRAKNGDFILVSAGPARNPGSVPVCIARWIGERWQPLYSSGGYCGVKMWQPLPFVFD